MTRSSLRSLLLTIVLISSNFVLAQQGEYILGKLLDAKTQEPIAFASIRIKDRALGIVSNIDGSFRLPVKYKEHGDIIEISSMGYQTQEFFIHDFSIYELNKVRLQPAILELEEAIVTAKQKKRKRLSARKIVRRAIDNILTNYPTAPYSKVGYYRDYQLENGKYVNLNEAILEVFDQGFQTVDTTFTKTRIYDYIKSSKFKRDTFADNPYDYKKGNKIIENAHLSSHGGNEFSILRIHDAIRNYQLNAFDFINGLKNGGILKNHSFRRMPDISFDDVPLYVIKLKRNNSFNFAIGIIYIAKTDFAIQKLEYAIYNKTKRNEKLGKRGIKAKAIMEVKTEYARNVNNKMYLNYISFYNPFKLRVPPKFVLETIKFYKQRENFVLTFNNRVNPEDALAYKNYQVYFRGEKLKFGRLVALDNQVLLFPKLKTRKQKKVWKDLLFAVENNNLNLNKMNFSVNGLRDVYGNLIHQASIKEYNQFREFFTQEVKSNAKLPKDTLFMNLRKPIFENQPVVKPDNFNDYWMNTPLQNIEN